MGLGVSSWGWTDREHGLHWDPSSVRLGLFNGVIQGLESCMEDWVLLVSCLVLHKQRDEMPWLYRNSVQCLASGTNENPSKESNGSRVHSQEFKVIVTCKGWAPAFGSMALWVLHWGWSVQCFVRRLLGFLDYVPTAPSPQLWQFKTDSRCRHLLERHSFIHVWVYVAWSRRLHSQSLNILAFRMERSHVYLEELCVSVCVGL